MHIAISISWDNGTQRALIEGQPLAISHGAGSAISTVRSGSAPSSTERPRGPSRTTRPTSAITAGFRGDHARTERIERPPKPEGGGPLLLVAVEAVAVLAALSPGTDS